MLILQEIISIYMLLFASIIYLFHLENVQNPTEKKKWDLLTIIHYKYHFKKDFFVFVFFLV